MVDIPSVSIVIASAGVLVVAIYYVLQIRRQTKLRQTDMVIRLYATFGSTEFQKAYQKVASLEFEDYADFRKSMEEMLKFGLRCILCQYSLRV